MDNKKKKVTIGVICALCAIIAVIVVVFVVKKQPSSNENTNNNNKIQDEKDNVNAQKKLEPENEENKKEEKKDENIKSDGTNSSVKEPSEGEITQEKAIRLVKKIVVPTISNDSNGGKVTVIERRKVNDDECYIVELSLMRDANKTQKCGIYAVSVSGKYIYSQDSKTKEYKKFVPNK